MTFGEFYATLRNVEENTRFEDFPVNGMSVILTDNQEYLAGISDNADEAASFAIHFKDEFDEIGHVARPIAWPSILARAKIAGTALSKLAPKTLEDVVNACLNVNKELGKAVIVDGRVSAVLSDGYRVLPVTEIFKLADDRFSQCGEFVSGYVDDTGFSATWKLSGNIARKYTDAYMLPLVELYTSNTGHSSVKLFPKMVKNNRVEFICGSPIWVEHKGTANMEDVENLVNMAYAQVNQSVLDMDQLHEIVINNPIGTFWNVAKKIGLPKKLAVLAERDFEDAIDPDELVTAYDIYLGLVESIFYAKESKEKRFVDNIQEIVARALTIHWHESDTAKIDWVVKQSA